jgi:SET domain-containing protein
MKFGTHHYKPLIQELTIAESPINGLGLFAVENIKAGIFLGESHIWEANRWEYIRTPLGGFINHSDNPNCFISTNIHYHHGNQRELYTTRPIKIGEEITVFYTVGYDDIL